MRIVFSILQRVLVNHFYKVNSGLFLFLFFVLFGLPQQPYSFHHALVKGILESQSFLFFVMALWLLFNLKCVDYIVKQIKEPQQDFLFCINNLSYKQRFAYLLYVHSFIYLPVLLYAGAITFMALNQGNWLYVLEVIAFNFTILIISTIIYINALKKKSFLPRINIPSVNFSFNQPLFLIPLLYMWHSRKQMLLITKFFSLLMLWIFFSSYELQLYDIRPLLLCMLLTVTAHCAIIFQLRSFEVEYLSFVKNLPLLAVIKFTNTVTSFLILLLPELIFLFKGYGTFFNWFDYPQLVLFTIALSCLFYTILLLDEMNMNIFIRVIFGIGAGCFFILLYNPGILFAFAILLLSYFLYSSYYYQFERKVNKM